MNRLLGLIENLSGTDVNLLKQLQKQLSADQVVLLTSKSKVETCLNSLDPGRHSLGFLHMLAVLAISNEIDVEGFVNQVSRFLDQCQPEQVRLDPKKYTLVCQKFTDICRELQQPIRAIRPLKRAIWKISYERPLITPQHYMLALACIEAQCYQAAISTLDRFVFEIDPKKTGLDSVHTRLYFYYGAICYIGMKMFDKALHFLEILLSVPATSGSMIIYEGYKKFILISLILDGRVSPVNQFTQPPLQRMYRQLSAPYEELSNAYSTLSIGEIQTVIAKYSEVFSRDHNMGLLKQVRESVFSRKLHRLTKTYATLSLSKVAELCEFEGGAMEAEKRLVDLIAVGGIGARINQKEGMVVFEDIMEDSIRKSKFTSPENLELMKQQIAKVIECDKKLKEIDGELGLSQKFLQKVLQADKNFGTWKGDMGPGGGPEEFGFGAGPPGVYR